jgi:DnaJ family protein C protein 11
VLTTCFLPQGTISVGVDATDLFDRYDEEYEDVSGSGFPQIEINKMHISQSIEVKHTNTSTSTAGAQVNEAQHRAAGMKVCSGCFLIFIYKGCNQPLKK